MPESLSCPNCREKIEATDKFCRACGFYLGKEPVERYLCNRCGHLNYVDLITQPAEKLSRCLACSEGLAWVKKQAKG
jgi:anaerobic ribonucleoside-triphosphate reductase